MSSEFLFDGTKLKKLREQAGYTQEQLAEILDIHKDTVRHIEQNKPSAIRGLKWRIVQHWESACAPRIGSSYIYEFKLYLKKVLGIS